MNPKNALEKATALYAIADAAEDLEKAGAAPFEVKAFTSGAREKLAEERPDYDKYAKAYAASSRFAQSNQ
jgi:ABC-type transport system substrate-binding protein